MVCWISSKEFSVLNFGINILISFFNEKLNKFVSAAFQRSVLTKLDTIIEKHDETLSILRVILTSTRGVDNDDAVLEDILSKPVDNVKDLKELSSRLEGETYKKKMVSFGAKSSVCSVSYLPLTSQTFNNI